MSIDVNQRLQAIREKRPKLILKIIRPETPIVYGYIRVSTSVQSKQGKSLQAQEEMIRRHCTEKGIGEPKIVCDPGYTGKTMEGRKEFMKMREEAKRGDTIIAYSLSRIGRSVKEISNFVDEMEKKGVRIVIIDKEIDLSTAQGRMFFNMLATVDQFEREVDGERISAVMQSMKREGKLITKAPYGFKIEGGKLVENEEEMKMIDLIITYIHDEPEIKVAEICRRLQWEVDIGNIKLRKAKVVHQRIIGEIIKRHGIRTTKVETATRTEIETPNV